MWLPKFSEVHGFKCKCEWLVYWVRNLFICAAVIVMAGCANSPSGVKITASSATYTNIGDINWDEYKIPVLSLYLGPKATVWVNKNYKALDEIEVNGSVTNTTTALAIYDSKENKTLNLRVKFRDDSTNGCSGVSAPAIDSQTISSPIITVTPLVTTNGYSAGIMPL